MAFQWNLLEDILDSVLHLATSFEIVAAESQLATLNAAVDADYCYLVSMFVWPSPNQSG